jgi:hypothetical protein
VGLSYKQFNLFAIKSSEETSVFIRVTEIIILFHKLLRFQEFELLIHICGSQAKEDKPAKEKIMNSLERNLCVL